MPGLAESYTFFFEQSNYIMYDVGCISGLKEAQNEKPRNSEGTYESNGIMRSKAVFNAKCILWTLLPQMYLSLSNGSYIFM